jgi:predicted metal-dependent hydrolase
VSGIDADFERGIELMRRREFFAAHEALEDAWRAAQPSERDFFQGLVHVTVASSHRGIDVGYVLEQVNAASGIVASGSLQLDPPRI